MMFNDNLDERQVAIRGKITTQTVIFTILLLLGIAFLNDAEVYDFDKNMGVSTLLICLVNVIIMFLSCNLILRDAYLGLFDNSRGKHICLVFSILFILLAIFMTIDILDGEGVTITSTVSMVMCASIAICMLIKRKSWS